MIGPGIAAAEGAIAAATPAVVPAVAEAGVAAGQAAAALTESAVNAVGQATEAGVQAAANAAAQAEDAATGSILSVAKPLAENPGIPSEQVLSEISNAPIGASASPADADSETEIPTPNLNPENDGSIPKSEIPGGGIPTPEEAGNPQIPQETLDNPKYQDALREITLEAKGQPDDGTFAQRALERFLQRDENRTQDEPEINQSVRDQMKELRQITREQARNVERLGKVIESQSEMIKAMQQNLWETQMMLAKFIEAETEEDEDIKRKLFKALKALALTTVSVVAGQAVGGVDSVINSAKRG